MQFLKSFNKKIFVGLVIVFVLVTGLALTVNQVKIRQNSKSKAATEARSNTLVFLLDDLDENTFNQMLTNNQLPNIKKYILDKGVRFSNSFVVDSICCSSRATFLTGKYPQNMGVYNVVGVEGGTNGFGSNINNNLATWLKSASFKTAHIGKFMNVWGDDKYQALANQYDYYRNVLGYDSRPGMFDVLATNTPPTQPLYNIFRPNLYQAKYLSDSAINFLNGVSTNNFFLVVAPHTPHINLPAWTLEGNQGGVFSAEIADSSVPFAGYSTFRSTDPAMQILKTVIKGPDSVGTYRWYENQKNSSGVWSGWTMKVSGTGTALFPGTGDKPVLAYNRMLHPEVANGYREHLLRGDSTIQYSYYRDTKSSVTGSWQLAGVTGSGIGSQTDLFAGTGNLPMVGYSSTELTPGTDIHQMVVRGNPTSGYELYQRARLNNVWQPWVKEAESWDTDSGWGPQFDMDTRNLGNGILELRIVRLESTSNKYVEYIQNIRSLYAAVPNTVLGDSTVNPLPEASISRQEDELFSSTTNTAPGVVTAGTPEYPHVYWSARVYADGNWVNAKPEQSYPASLYPGGKLPAGTLRQNGDSNGFTPLSAAFDLPHRTAANFNSNTVCDPGKKSAFICNNWPDLNQAVRGGKTQLDYVKRQFLDREEAMISLDVMVGEVMKKVEAMGVLNNTLVIFTSDNGLFSGEFRMGNKMWAYEDSIRVPLVVRLPNSTLTAGKVNQNTIANIDLAPTIMDYSGLQWSSGTYNVDGRSLRPLLESPLTLVSNWRKYFPVQFHYPRDWTDNTQTKKKPSERYVFNKSWEWAWALPDIAALRIGQEAKPTEFKNYLYNENIEDPLHKYSMPAQEIYNMNTDPVQLNNLASATAADTRNLMHKLLTDLTGCSGAICRTLDIGWQIDSEAPFNATIESATVPIAGFSMFDPPDPNITMRRTVIKGTLQSGYTWYENNRNTSGVWSGWQQISLPAVTGNQFPGTDNTKSLIYYNAFVFPGMINGYREHISRGNVAGAELHYYRDVINGVAGNWLPSATPNTTSALMPNTGNLPVVGFSAKDLPNNNIIQYILRGSQTYELYSRSRINNVWTAWAKDPAGWNIDTGSGPMIDMDAVHIGSSYLELRIIRKDIATNKYVIFKRTLKSPQ